MEANRTEQLLGIIKEEFEQEVTASTTFEQMGIDSLDYLLLLQQVKKKIGPVVDEKAMTCNTVGELLSVIG